MLRTSLSKKANITFLQILGIGIGFLSLLLVLGFQLYPRLYLFTRSLLGKLETLCGCANHFVFSNHPFIFTFLIFLGISIFIFFAYLIYRVFKIIRSTKTFIDDNLKKKKLEMSRKLNQIANFLDLSKNIVEIETSQAIIFCYGIFRPMVCISAGLVKKLSKKELMAVLMHERQHIISYEPIKIFIVKLTSKVLFFVPGLKILTNQYLTFSELTADQKATNNFQNKAPLAKALYKVIKLQKKQIFANNLALSFFSGITEERINKLSDNKYNPIFRFFTIKLTIGLLLILISPYIFNVFVSSNQINYTGTYCPMMQVETKHQCEILIEKDDCAMNYSSMASICEK